MKRSSKWAALLGFPEEQWAGARVEVREAIEEAARNRMMTTYTEVAGKVAVMNLTPHSEVLRRLLGEVLEEEHETGRLALTALVTHKTGDLEPGRGFYNKAREVGWKFSDPHEFWWRQVEAIFKRYGGGRR